MKFWIILTCFCRATYLGVARTWEHHLHLPLGLIFLCLSIQGITDTLPKMRKRLRIEYQTLSPFVDHAFLSEAKAFLSCFCLYSSVYFVSLVALIFSSWFCSLVRGRRLAVIPFFSQLVLLNTTFCFRPRLYSHTFVCIL